MAGPWYEDRPDLVKEIKDDLARHYPSLRLAIENGGAEVRGTFPIYDNDGMALDRWKVSIFLPNGYPGDLPIVRETGNRIPHDLDNHVLPIDGSACVMLPETRFLWFPRNAPLKEYLDGPLRSFFANQSHRALGGNWVHGEWDHGPIAAVQFYRELLQSEDQLVGWRTLIAMGTGLKESHPCPCGLRSPVQTCHPVLLDVRNNLGEDAARGRLVGALQQKLGIQGVDTVISVLRALHHRVKGHHTCPCGSGNRVRDCHPGIRELNGAIPRSLSTTRRKSGRARARRRS